MKNTTQAPNIIYRPIRYGRSAIGALALFFLLTGADLHGQTLYRSIASGDWNAPSTWEVSADNGASWMPAVDFPISANSDGILVRSPHTVNVTASLTIDQTEIAAGAMVLQLERINISDGPGDDLLVNGTLMQDAGLFVLLSGSTMLLNGTYHRSGGLVNGNTLIFNDGGTYVHALNGGGIPTATWHPNSNCRITGMTTDYPGNMGVQTFGNLAFVLDSNDEVTMAGLSLECQGNLHFSNTGIGSFWMTKNNANRSISVGGNFTMASGNFVMKGGSGQATLTVQGDFIKTGGTFIQRSGAGGNADPFVTVGGDFVHTAGVYNLSQNQTSILNVGGDFAITGGTLIETGPGNAAGEINFNGAGAPQVYTSGGTVSNAINFTVHSGAFLQMAAANTEVEGAGRFTLEAGATLGIRGAGGIAAMGATGQIRVADSRSYNAAANYIYDGSSPQVTGSGFPANLSGTLTVLNSSGVTLTNPLTIAALGNLRGDGLLITAGTEVVNNGGILPGTSIGTLTIDGDLSFSATASLETELRGTPGKDNDSLAVSGNVAFAGTLNVHYLGGTISTNDEFVIVTYGSRTGTFATINYPPPSVAAEWVADYQANQLVLRYVGALLPIELLFFEAEKLGRRTLLTWRTASEKDNDFMAVERSADGRAWQELGRVRGAGTTTLPQDYRFVDERPLPGLNYYRLRQVDFDGTTEYHRVVALDFRSDKRGEPRLFPNPAHERLTVALPSAATEPTELLLLDVQGRVQRRWAVPAGEIQQDFGLEGLAPGLYFLRVAGLERALRVVVN